MNSGYEKEKSNLISKVFSIPIPTPMKLYRGNDYKKWRYDNTLDKMVNDINSGIITKHDNINTLFNKYYV
jgi:hypothetical protein